MITTKPQLRRWALALMVLLAVLLAGCSGSSSVGSGVNLHSSGGGGNLSLGSTTTAAAGHSSAPSTAAPTTAPPTTSAPATSTPVTSPPTTAAAAYVIHINGDASGQPAFDPTNVAVYQGTTVEWINTDSKPHSVVASDGAFTSPSIPPGGRWSWVANTVGRHSYADGTRPYAVGTLEVAAR